jgi:hypothetical protein
LVVFIDEIDSLQNQTLISVLRQLRDGFPRWPQGFPHSLVLIGMRDVRDYKVKSDRCDSGLIFWNNATQFWNIIKTK